MSGIVINDTPDIDELERRLRRIFGLRLGVPTLEGDEVYFCVSTANGNITGRELLAVLSALDVGAERLCCHTLPPDDVRFIVDLTADTAPAIPSLIQGVRHP